MKKTNFYPTIWSIAAYTPSVMADWYGTEANTAELILKNEAATALHVSEMTLNITKFSAIDEQGNEHFIIDFPGQNPVTLKGIASGNFMRSKSVLSLPEGRYTALRFYMAGWGNQFIYQDGAAESANSFNRLDFQIEDGFTVEEGNAPKLNCGLTLLPTSGSDTLNRLRICLLGAKVKNHDWPIVLAIEYYVMKRNEKGTDRCLF